MKWRYGTLQISHHLITMTACVSYEKKIIEIVCACHILCEDNLINDLYSPVISFGLS